MADPIFLSPDHVKSLHWNLVAEFAEDDPIDPPGVKDEGLLDSACHRPLTGLGRVYKYKTIYSQVAALFHSLVMNHAFHNGNKRTALVAAIQVLNGNKRRLEVTDDELFELVVAVARGEFPEADLPADRVVEGIADWFADNSVRIQPAAATMKVTEFLDKCRLADCTVREYDKGKGWLIRAPGGRSLKIGKQVRWVERSTIKHHLSELQISTAYTGVLLGEFAEGIDPSDIEMIRRYRGVLNRLAHA